MQALPEHAWATRALTAIARLGRPGHELAVGLDVLLSAGPVHALRDRTAHGRREQARPGRGPERIWSHAARELGAEVRELPGGFLEIREGERRARVWEDWGMLDDVVTVRLTLEKKLVHRLLADAGLPVASQAGFRAGDLSPALGFLARHGDPCVVKPARGDPHTAEAAPWVCSPSHLRRAALRLGRRHRELLIEEQPPGDVHRLLFLDGELLDVLHRIPPSVTGDGRSSLGELIEAENRRRAADPEGWARRITIDLDCLFTLERAGLTLASVPVAGERVRVKTATSQNRPEDNRSVMGHVSPALAAEAARAAEAVGVRLAGVDVVTADAGMSLARSGGAILAVDATPGLYHHYAVGNPEQAIPVAIPVLKRLLDTEL
jgi:cyanophycin synthetase